MEIKKEDGMREEILREIEHWQDCPNEHDNGQLADRLIVLFPKVMSEEDGMREFFSFQVSEENGEKILWLCYKNGMFNLNAFADTKTRIIGKALKEAIANALSSKLPTKVEYCKCPNPHEDFSSSVHPNHCKHCHKPIKYDYGEQITKEQINQALLALDKIYKEKYLGMVVDDFEDFLAEKHAKQYIGTKDCMIDDFNKWVQDLGCDDFIGYGNEYHAEIRKRIKEG